MNYEDILAKLISFPTISETSNKDMTNFIKSYLFKYGHISETFEGNNGQFNLHCRIGPRNDGGIILSGHTDVVPTTGQKWITNPFKLTKKNNRLYGRGSCDMKGFIATILSIIPDKVPDDYEITVPISVNLGKENGIEIPHILDFLTSLDNPTNFVFDVRWEDEKRSDYKGRDDHIKSTIHAGENSTGQNTENFHLASSGWMQAWKKTVTCCKCFYVDYDFQ